MSQITRRDFLNGVALTIASGLSPAAQLAAKPLLYPPALTGLRGQQPGSYETAHALRDGQLPAIGELKSTETYDLVVVGAGISGLAAAYFYRQRNPAARILVLDNNDDFGGHARRNEFTIGKRLLLGYGGSESMELPKRYSVVAKALLKDLKVDVGAFETAFERHLYPKLGLGRGLFFPKESFERDVLVVGDPTRLEDDDIPENELNAKTVEDFVALFPVSSESKRQLVDLYEQKTDPLAGRSAEEKIGILRKTSYRDYLIKILRCTEEVANCFQGRSLDLWALAIDAIPASVARETGFPGFSGLGLPKETNEEEPYIYHFPDGNASLARLLVRAMVPKGAPGRTMQDIVLADFDYSMLDQDDERVRIRLNSTCVHLRNEKQDVELTYVRGEKPFRVRAKHAVLACFNMMISYLMPELPKPQLEALAQNVKAPLVYSNVLVRNWKPWATLGIHEIVAPMSFHCRVKLDYPVNLGGYRHPADPEEPMVLHLVHVPSEPAKGLTARDQFRLGRQKLFEMTFKDFEDAIRGDLTRMLGPGGFAADRDIAAITVNCWAHGYAYTANTLYDGDDTDRTIALARKRAGRVAIANSDAAWDAYANSAIDQAHRAVRELLG